MSQAGIINFIENNPNIPIIFNADTGFAEALFNEINIFGTGGIVTSATGNTITIDGSGISSDVTINGDTGSITGAVLTIYANNASNNCGATVNFTNTGTISTLNVTTPLTWNTFIGTLAGNNTTTGARNTSLGYVSLNSITSGNFNTAVGYSSLVVLTEGLANCSFGYDSGGQIITGNYNNTFGYLSGRNLQSGSENCTFGSSALTAGIGANQNSFFGNLIASVSVSACTLNSAIGYRALNNLTSGSNNTSLGASTLNAITTGARNIAVGYLSGSSLTVANSNNILMSNTGTVGDNNTIRIGTQGSGAGQQNICFIAGIVGVTVSNQQFVTIDSVTGQLGATSSTGGVTSVTGTANQITASPTTGAVILTIPSTFIAPGSIASTTTTTGGTGLIATTGNVTVTNGNLTLPTTSSTVGQIIVNSSRFMHSFGSANTFLGQSAGNFTLSSGNCTAIGYFSGSSLTSGNNNTFVGMEAGQNVNSGSENTAVGFQSLVTCQSGVQNCAIGRAALNNCSGDQNTMVGYNAGTTISSGIKNTGVGNQALISLGSGNENIGIGYNSGISYTGSESNNIIFANNGVVGESNTIRLGNFSVQTRNFMAGIAGVTISNGSPVVIDTTTGQLGNGITTANSAIASGSAVSLTSTVNSNVTSISLAAGTWIVTGVIQLGGTPTVTGAQQGSISTTSATHGTLGDNSIQVGWLDANFIVGNVPITIPSYILTIGSTTTVYLVASGVFSLGTMTAYGRLNAFKIA